MWHVECTYYKPAGKFRLEVCNAFCWRLQNITKVWFASEKNYFKKFLWTKRMPLWSGYWKICAQDWKNFAQCTHKCFFFPTELLMLTHTKQFRQRSQKEFAQSPKNFPSTSKKTMTFSEFVSLKQCWRRNCINGNPAVRTMPSLAIFSWKAKKLEIFSIFCFERDSPKMFPVKHKFNS